MKPVRMNFAAAAATTAASSSPLQHGKVVSDVLVE